MKRGETEITIEKKTNCIVKENLDKVADEADVIVNCCGLGAFHLVSSDALKKKSCQYLSEKSISRQLTKKVAACHVITSSGG